MKYLVQTACAALLGVFGISTYSYAVENGINYDPTHSSDYVEAQKKNNIGLMVTIINMDLNEIKNKIGFTSIKTFYSAFGTIDGENCINITQKAKDFGLKVLLGLYEFPDHADWTVSQVNAAIEAAKNYPSTVVGIAVGNEDMFGYDGTPIQKMQERIVADMQTIKNGISNPSIKVTTAQREPDWYRLAESDPNKVLPNVEVIGANIYPFWGNSPEKINDKSVAYNIQATVKNLISKTNKIVIVTEEGWPSCGGNPNTQDKNIKSEIDYFTSWKKRNTPFDSYYFAAYDNYKSTCPNGDANDHFGLCLASGATKDSGLVTCR